MSVGCGADKYYRPWRKRSESCPDPGCDASIKIVNAWETKIPRVNKRAAALHGEFKHWWGFSAIITIPEDDLDDEEFTILLRFPGFVFH